VKIGKRGQVIIPQALREEYGFLPGTEVEFVARDGALLIVKKQDAQQRALAALYGRKRFGRSTDGLMKLLRERRRV
jgi:AbrB family looped-hinge helix DNA binding protein